MHEVGQKFFQQNDPFRMTEIGHECHRDRLHSLVSSTPVSEHHTSSTVLVMRVLARSCTMTSHDAARIRDERCFQQRKQAEW